jgi:hypothetical protein
MKKVIDNNLVCNLVVHLCAKCRKIPHNELLKKFEVPDNLCDTCKERFVCFLNKGAPPMESIQQPCIVDGKTENVHRNWLNKIGRRRVTFSNLFNE